MKPKPVPSLPVKRKHWLAGAIAGVPALAITLGIPLADQQEPRVFGMPFLVAWIIAWILATPLFLYAAYKVEGR